MLDGAYGFYAAFPFFLSIPVGESFSIPSVTEPPSSPIFCLYGFWRNGFLVGKNPTLLMVMKMLKWVYLWTLAHPQLLLFDVMLKSHHTNCLPSAALVRRCALEVCISYLLGACSVDYAARDERRDCTQSSY